MGSFRELLARWKADRPGEVVGVAADGSGVRFRLDDGTEFRGFRWGEVLEIRTYKRDNGIVDDIRLVFQTADRCHDLGEDLAGFSRLGETMRGVFPSIPGDWYGVVMQPPFATNERTLFRSPDGE